ncbi:MAG TPA: hypothetical protein PKV72_05840, partial [Candidatus Peribacteria bacterium]|nr:hypothetical protein [Candidatus Peribacteria bacterium]
MVLAIWLQLLSELSDQDFLTCGYSCKVPVMKAALLRHAIENRALTHDQLAWLAQMPIQSVAEHALAALAGKDDLSAQHLFLLACSGTKHSGVAAEKLLAHPGVYAYHAEHMVLYF